MTLKSDWSDSIQKAEALIFDMDGTLIDSMPAHFKAWQQVCEEFRLSITRERFYQLGGVPTYETLEILSAESGINIDLDAAKVRKESLYRTYVEDVVEISAIADIARQYSGRKPLAVATGAGRENAETMLRRLALDSLFDAVLTADDVKAHKPAPDVFLQAASALAVAPSACLAFEDTDIGLQAIRAAGMTAVDVRPILSASFAE